MMGDLKIILVIAIFSIACTWAAYEEDKVEYLPGLEEQPTFNHYAGYLTASNGTELFYW